MTIEATHESRTYKFRAEGISDSPFYFTIVGGGVPEGLFINSKRLEEFQWITALMESYFRQLQAGIPVADVIRDMKSTFDPNGHYYANGEQMRSMVHHLGIILERHMAELDRQRGEQAPDVPLAIE